MEVEGRKDDEESGGGVVRQPQKKVKGDVKQRWKIGFHNQVNVLSLSKIIKTSLKNKGENTRKEVCTRNTT